MAPEQIRRDDVEFRPELAAPHSFQGRGEEAILEGAASSMQTADLTPLTCQMRCASTRLPDLLLRRPRPLQVVRL
jgi:hypothetical protein